MINIEEFELQSYADSYFNGDLRVAIEYIFKNYETAVIKQMARKFTKEQSILALNIIEEKVKSDEFKKIAYKEASKLVSLQHLELTKEEVMNAEKNPYKAKYMKQFLGLLIMEGGLVALNLFASSLGANINILNHVGVVLSSMLAVNVGTNLVKYFEFKKLKKQYNLEQEDKEHENSTLISGRNR